MNYGQDPESLLLIVAGLDQRRGGTIYAIVPQSVLSVCLSVCLSVSQPLCCQDCPATVRSTNLCHELGQALSLCLRCFAREAVGCLGGVSRDCDLFVLF